MATYSYVSDNGIITSRTTSYSWRSLCHNEDVMDGWSIYLIYTNWIEEVGGFGWSVCRLCGRQNHFRKQWPQEKKETYDCN